MHDQVNLALIPLIGALTVAGLVGAIDPAVTTYAFLAYVALDSVWLILQVRCMSVLQQLASAAQLGDDLQTVACSRIPVCGSSGLWSPALFPTPA